MELTKKQFLWIVIIPTVFIIAGTILTYCLDSKIHLGYFINPSEYNFHYDYLGDFGDFLGGFVGTLLTLIATIYVYKAYTSQNKQLELQEKELESQRKELNIQREFTKNQQFETTFFNLINVHRELKNSLKLESDNDIFRGGWGINPITYSGVEVLSKIGNDFVKLYNTEFIFGQLPDNNTLNEKISEMLENDFEEIGIDEKFGDINNPKPALVNIDEIEWSGNNNSKEIHLEKINYFFKLLFKNYQNQISHYCRNVYHILKFIRENEIREDKGEESKIKFKQYANLFQSQLTVNEQILLYYNFITFNNEEKGIFSTISLVNHYKFLENIGLDNLIFKKHEEFYNFQIKGSDRIPRE